MIDTQGQAPVLGVPQDSMMDRYITTPPGHGGGHVTMTSASTSTQAGRSSNPFSNTTPFAEKKSKKKQGEFHNNLQKNAKIFPENSDKEDDGVDTYQL
eukprot:CAMPEP_0197854044 /NCGR_PEP_ID=MMETSP1438-20131217/23939_1 /TAXON_ID=1461541 /ORGANISM="Pterosperma sp., Strain CCMP1384" /LENGTH=97 /DNA_ID=CAMNT_0043468667 /DNA_START=68 /DNA_END=361 /DNA_ORIENTATION=+